MRNFSCIVNCFLMIIDLLYYCRLNLEPLHARQCALPLSLFPVILKLNQISLEQFSVHRK